MGHDRKKFRFCPARRLGLQTSLALEDKLLGPLFSFLTIGDIPEGYQLHGRAIPFRYYNPKLGVHNATTATLDNLDLGGFAHHKRKPEGRAYQLMCFTVEKELSCWIREPDAPLMVHNYDAIRQPLDDRPKARRWPCRL